MISVVIPYYQTEEILFDACIKSILFDIEADIEVIIVDDGSATKYHANVDKFLKDRRVKVFHMPHQGVSFARNYGIDTANGEWLMFVDSDDTLELDWYKKLHQFVDGRVDDVILFNGFKDIDGKLSKNIFFTKENIDYGQDVDLKKQIMESSLSVGYFPRGFRNHYSLGSPCSKLYRTEFLRKNQLQFDVEVTFAEDTLFSLKVYHKATHIFYTDKYLYHYVLNRVSSTQKYRPGLEYEMDVFFGKIQSFMEAYCLKKQLENSYYRRVFFEIQRAMKCEFFNKSNNKPNFVKCHDFENFIAKEPYKTGLKNAMTINSDIKGLLSAFLITHKMYILLINLINIYTNLRRKCICLKA